MKKYLLITFLCLVTSFKAWAEPVIEPTTKPQSRFFSEISAGIGFYSRFRPYEFDICGGYRPVNRLKIRAMLQNYIIQSKGDHNSSFGKDGVTTNLGVGIGYVFLKPKNEKKGEFELRLSGSRTIIGNEIDAADLGIYWNGKSDTAPYVGVSLSLKDFPGSNDNNFLGLMLTLGFKL